MKIRNGFVSNSSSSSFVISKKHVTAKQRDQIINHIKTAKHYRFARDRDTSYGVNLELDRLSHFCTEPYDEWDISESETELKGDAWLDNFDMREFFALIGINKNDVVWGE